MKRILCLLLACLVLLSGCTQSAPPGQRQGEERLVVYASIYPLYEFAGQIAGDKAEVRLLVPAGGEAHDWEPTPADIAALENAQVFLYNGAGLEHWVDTVLQALQNEALLAVETSNGLDLLDGHSHDDGGDAHDHEEEDGGHSHGGLDPHVWLSPVNAAAQCDMILQALVQADPENGAYYQQRYDAYRAELESLHSRYQAALEPYKGSDIVVAHEAFGYLCHEYGLHQTGVQGFSPDAEPDPASMAAVIDFVRERDVKVIFFEQDDASAVAQAIARETGAEIGVLNPLESLSKAQVEDGANYITVMDDNLQALLAALQ